MTETTPEWASEPVTVMPRPARCQPPGATVSSVGSTVSTFTVWSCHTETLPATSKARVRRMCEPSPMICTSVSLAPLWIAPPSSCHSMWSTPDTGSTAETVTGAGGLASS